MMRQSAHWVTNVKRGGKPVAAVADATMRDLAVAATAVVAADFAGVDMVYDQDARLSVLEVNSMPAWSGLQQTTSIDIAATLASDLVASLRLQVQRNVSSWLASGRTRSPVPLNMRAETSSTRQNPATFTCSPRAVV